MEVCTIGGYEEVGKNMTTVKIGEDVIIIDCGFYLPGVIELQEEHHVKKYTTKNLRSVGGIPDDRVLDELGWRDKVKAILISHAHLDHVGGLPFLIDRYPKAQVYGLPFTLKVLESIIEDEGIVVKNKLNYVKPNSTHPVPGADPSLKVEFIHTTHSTIDCAFIAIHSKEKSLFYTLDFKFDDKPILENPPNYTRLKEIGESGTKVVIMDSLYADKEEPQGGELEAKAKLEEAFKNLNNDKNKAIFVTTFSSHIERLTSIVELAKQTNREIVFLGRSLAKYVQCAIEVGKCPFQNDIRVLKYARQRNSFLKKLEADRGKYLIVCTGHQGENGSILDRLSRNETPFRFREGDNIIISSSVIPTESNIESRKILDSRFRKMGVNLQVDVHVHGHGSRNDKRKVIELLKPEYFLAAHGNLEQEQEAAELSTEFGYVIGKTALVSRNGKTLNF